MIDNIFTGFLIGALVLFSLLLWWLKEYEIFSWEIFLFILFIIDIAQKIHRFHKRISQLYEFFSSVKWFIKHLSEHIQEEKYAKQ